MEKQDNLGGDKLPASHLVGLAQHRLGKLSPPDSFVTIAGILTSSSHCSTCHQDLTQIFDQTSALSPRSLFSIAVLSTARSAGAICKHF